MYVKIFEGKTADEVENKVNQYLEKESPEEFDLYNVIQSECATAIEGRIERIITVTLVFNERLYSNDNDDF